MVIKGDTRGLDNSYKETHDHKDSLGTSRRHGLRV